MKSSFAEEIIKFNQSFDVNYNNILPNNYKIINPFIAFPPALHSMEKFYTKYYSDHFSRKFIIGINPGRLGAAITGIPFTDTKRLEEHCNIFMEEVSSHEVSSVFVYDMIQAWGGVASFYQNYYINSPLPFALVKKTKNGKWRNANYYDSSILFEALKNVMISSLELQLSWNLNKESVIILGKKNADFIKRLFKEMQFYPKITVLEHPRYIQQYKFKERDFYIEKYLQNLD